MAHIVEDRILESTTSTGTGALTLAGAVTGFRAFNAVCAVGDTVPYFIEAIDSLGQPTGDYEYGIGTYSAADELTRTTVHGSSNAGSAVNFVAGSKNVGIAFTKAELAKLAPLASPDFTGSPTAPTQASSDNSTKLATTAWVRLGLAMSLGSSGYIKLPSWLGGVVIQWTAGSVTSGSSVSFPIAFPAACHFVIAGGSGAYATWVNSFTTTQANVGHSGSGSQGVRTLSIGV